MSNHTEDRRRKQMVSYKRKILEQCSIASKAEALVRHYRSLFSLIQHLDCLLRLRSELLADNLPVPETEEMIQCEIAEIVNALADDLGIEVGWHKPTNG